MKLLTKEIETRFAKLGDQDIPDPIVVAKFFNPTGVGTWLATAYVPEDRVFFGYVSLGMDDELGYFSLDELQEFKGRFGLGIERDTSWHEMPLSAAKIKEHLS